MRRIIKNVLPIILPISFLIGWQVLSKKINNQIILPSVNSIVKIIVHPKQDLISIGSLYRNTYVSLIRVGIGYIFAIVVAVPLGVLIGYSRTIERLLSTFLNLFRPIPPLAWVPLVLAWFGIASFATLFNIDIYNPSYSLLNGIKISMIFIIFIGAFFPILTNTVYGIRTVRKTLIDSALTLGAKNIDILTKVLLPGAMPSILTGLRVGLGEFGQSFPYELSGGMQQRAAIAKAIVNSPNILYMDEPFGALDAYTRHKMQEDLVEFWLEEKRTIIFVTHSVEEAILLGTRVIVMSHRPGEIIEDFKIDLTYPRNRWNEGFGVYFDKLMDLMQS